MADCTPAAVRSGRRWIEHGETAVAAGRAASGPAFANSIPLAGRGKSSNGTARAPHHSSSDARSVASAQRHVATFREKSVSEVRKAASHRGPGRRAHEASERSDPALCAQDGEHSYNGRRRNTERGFPAPTTDRPKCSALGHCDCWARYIASRSLPRASVRVPVSRLFELSCRCRPSSPRKLQPFRAMPASLSARGKNATHWAPASTGSEGVPPTRSG